MFKFLGSSGQKVQNLRDMLGYIGPYLRKYSEKNIDEM